MHADALMLAVFRRLCCDGLNIAVRTWMARALCEVVQGSRPIRSAV